MAAAVLSQLKSKLEEGNKKITGWEEVPKAVANKVTPQVPWLMVPHEEEDCKVLRFFDLSEGKVYNLNLPKTLHGGFCCGSSKGWLVIAKKSSSIMNQMLSFFTAPMPPKTEVFLFDPISEALHQLPSLSTIPCFEECIDIAGFVDRIELSTSDISECVIGGIFSQGKVLAFCKPGDEKWSMCEGRDPRYHQYDDILFYKGKFHVLTWNACDCEVIHVPELKDYDHESIAMIEYMDYIIPVMPEWLWLSSHLVESSNGELLLITSFANRKKSRPFFDVWRIDQNDRSILEDDVISRNEVMFLLGGGSYSVLATTAQIPGKCIYFVGQCSCYADGHDLFPLVAQMALYCLQADETDTRSQPDFPLFNITQKHKRSWFTPTLNYAVRISSKNLQKNESCYGKLKQC